MKNTESGRSMIEMICVLAIICMLSVGGLWGYTEVMIRYKLSKAAAQYSQLFAATDQMLETHSFLSSNGMHVAQVLEKMNLLPPGMGGKNGWKDALGNGIELFETLSYYIHYTGNKGTFLLLGEDTATITNCVNVFEIAKNYASSPYFRAAGIFGGYDITLSPDRDCTGSRKCLSKYDTIDFYKVCSDAYQRYVDDPKGEFVQTVIFRALK